MTTDPADTAEARDRRAKVDNIIVVGVAVTLFIVLEIIVPEIVKARMAEHGIRPDVMTGLAILAIITLITIVVGWLLAWLLRWRAEKMRASSS